MKEIIRTYAKIFHSGLRWYEQLFVYVALLISFVPPIVFSFQARSAFVLPKLYWFLILMVAVTFALIWKMGVEKKMELKSGRFNILILCYAISLCISAYGSINIYTSLFGIEERYIGLITMIGLLLLLFFVGNFLKKPEARKVLLVSGYVAAIIVVTFALTQHYGVVLIGRKLTGVAIRAFGTMGHANHLGGFIVQFMCVSGALFVWLKSRWMRGGIIFLNLIFLVGLFETSSRGAFLTLIFCALLVLFGAALIYRDVWKSHVKRILVGGLIGLLVFVGAGVVFKDKIAKIGVVERTIQTFEFIGEGNIPDRLSWIYSSLEMVSDKPFFGHGVATFKDAYPKYRRLDYRLPGDYQDTIVPNTAHNEYLNIAATEGLVSLFFYLSLIGFILLTAVRKMRAEVSCGERESALFHLFLMGSVFAYLAQVVLNFGTMGTIIPFYLLLGILYAETSMEDEYESKQKGWLSVVLVTSMIFFVLSTVMYHQLFRADIFMNKAADPRSKIIYDDKGYLYAINSLSAAIELHPYSYGMYEDRGINFMRQALLESEVSASETYLLLSLDSFKEALIYNDTQPSTHANKAFAHELLAQLYEQSNRNGKAREQREYEVQSYEDALSNSRSNPLYTYKAADGYFNAGENENALELLYETEEIRPGYEDVQERIEFVLKTIAEED